MPNLIYNFTFEINSLIINVKATDVQNAASKIWKKAISYKYNIFQLVKAQFPTATNARFAGRGNNFTETYYLLIIDKKGNILTELEITDWTIN